MTATAADLPWTIGALVERAASAHPQRIAIEDGPVSLTYRALDDARLAAAAAFCAYGIRRGDRVAIWAPNGYAWIVAALGLQSLGAALVPINTRFRGAEAGHVLDRSRARLLLTVGEFLGTRYPALLQDRTLPHLERVLLLDDADDGGQPWSAFLQAGTTLDPGRLARALVQVQPDDPSDVMFTSGTTGSPRGVVTSHAQNLRTFRGWAQLAGLRADDRYLIVNPFFHAFGYKAGWLACLLQGCTILPHAVFDVAAVLERIERNRIGVLPGPPTLYQSLLSADLQRHDLSSLRLAVTGAASIPVSLVERMRDELGFETVLTAYGLTESCGVVTMCRAGDDAHTIATTSGRAIDGVEVACVDDAGAPVLAGSPGEVLVRGFNVMQGYLEDPEATAASVDSDGWLHTGDIGILDAHGYLRITDRKKDMFIMGGFNCYPAEIESLMLANRNYAQVAVIGVPDPRMGEVAMAFVVPRPGAQLDAPGVIAWCRENLANYKVPRTVRIVDGLPLNASGKVQKFALRSWAQEGSSAAR